MCRLKLLTILLMCSITHNAVDSYSSTSVNYFSKIFVNRFLKKLSIGRSYEVSNSATVSTLDEKQLDVRLQGRVINRLKEGKWIKFICGASNQDIPLIRNLCFLYTLAGVDCIDMSADIAVISAALDGITAALSFDNSVNKPLIMISVNDDEDLHFRKASFDPKLCPSNCSRPCERICPAIAIPPFNPSMLDGVIEEKCYGCGRCIDVCPIGLIDAKSYVVSASSINDLLSTGVVDAIEIHTHHGNELAFDRLWNSIGNSVLSNVAVVAVSFPDMDTETYHYINRLYSTMQSNLCWSIYSGINIWQTDGRPMSGDIGKGTVHASTQFGKKLLTSYLEGIEQETELKNSINFNSGREFVQLAGGTNNYSGQSAKKENLFSLNGFGGFAFGGYARKTINKYLQEIEERSTGSKIEDNEEQFQLSLDFVSQLVGSVREI